MNRKWTAQEANAWYEKLGWLRGCNFMGSDCANRLDTFQSYKSEEKLARADKELALAKEIGFNTVRIWANFDVYYAEPESFMEIFEKYIALFNKHGQKVMVVLGYEEDLPSGDVFVPKKLGEQDYALGEHFGRFPLREGQEELPQRHYLEYPETKEKFREMVQRIVRKYREDERIFCWNIWNEPGAQCHERTVGFLEDIFALVRAEDPVQPLCADIWRGLENGQPKTAEEQKALELSDVISFHSYQDYCRFLISISELKKFGRPIFVTEWLHRINHNNVKEIYPLLFLEKIGCYCWGFVVGKTQTNEPWPNMWTDFEKGWRTDYDFTKWQHDLFRPNLHPYDPNEIAIIRRFNALADEKN